ncbi:MAG TPA: TIGR03915 family putative DNA repair protein, partial [Anaeromyxobacteraceae bacterium]|nr:TIGR03915 family putative DNA repair protein [Anaeromyxobacteraceae bacterium]
MKFVHVDGTFEHWRAVARELLAQRAPPAEVAFSEEDPGELLPGFAAEATASYAAADGARTSSCSVQGVDAPRRVPAVFLSLARRVACHRDPSRWTRLYRVLWRVVHDDARVLQDPTDEEVAALDGMAEAVRQDIHRVHALVRFRRVEDACGERYVAFHRPDHRTLRPAAPFFAHRFAGMRWSILTPDDSV